MNSTFEMIIPGEKPAVGAGNLVHPFGLGYDVANSPPRIADDEEEQAPRHDKTYRKQNWLECVQDSLEHKQYSL